MKIRSAVLERTGGPLDVRELTLAPPEEGELLVRIEAAGLCHSDLSVIDGSRPRPLPMALGHEAAGVVAESRSPEFAEGDHVVLTFVPACGSCPPCVAGRPALCVPGAAANRAGTLLGGGRRLGGVFHHLGVSAFSEFAVVSARSAVKVPARLPFEVAALFGCAVLTGAGAALYAAGVGPRDSVAVFGLGGVGLSALLAAKAAGAGALIAVDVVEGKRDLALALGATHAVPGGAGAVERVRELTGGGAVKVVDTTGVAPVLAQAYAATAPGGVTVTVGLPAPDAGLTIPALSLVAEEKTLRGSYLGSCVPRRDVPRFVAMYESGALPVDRLLSDRLRLGRVNEGFERLKSGQAVRQVVLMR
ncbi:zinc-binding dehydrogenase [Herbidospora galbida]|uniref:Zinc-binding dehydrogenase n=1 Tax=Herbidospora galbida TaxID=2575442 RepID=A0A4U3M666_9ACTN|nr:zinc-binding dehydrogenase [Herbidospora galbida]TKK84281.1 zinc-binding dehydrogenase [Herbidospora galbida]